MDDLKKIKVSLVMADGGKEDRLVEQFELTDFGLKLKQDDVYSTILYKALKSYTIKGVLTDSHIKYSDYLIKYRSEGKKANY